MQWRNAAAPLKVVIPWEKKKSVLHLPPAVFVIQRTTTFFQKKVNFKIFLKIWVQLFIWISNSNVLFSSNATFSYLFYFSLITQCTVN